MGWFIEKRLAKRLPVLDFEGKATFVMIDVYGSVFAQNAMKVSVEYYIGKNGASLSVCLRKPRKQKGTHYKKAAESVACAVFAGHDHNEKAIGRCVHTFFSDEIFCYPNREMAAANAKSMNAILAYAEKHSNHLLALELFGLNYFESHYRADRYDRKQTLFEIFRDRESLIEDYEEEIRTLKHDSEVQA
jgi:hypothetical protein